MAYQNELKRSLYKDAEMALLSVERANEMGCYGLKRLEKH